MNNAIASYNTQLLSIVEEVKGGDFEKAIIDAQNLDKSINNYINTIGHTSLDNQLSDQLIYLSGKNYTVMGKCFFLLCDYGNAKICYINAAYCFSSYNNLQNDMWNCMLHYGCCYTEILDQKFFEEYQQALMGKRESPLSIEIFGKASAIGYIEMQQYIKKDRLDATMHHLFYQLAPEYLDKFIQRRKQGLPYE